MMEVQGAEKNSDWESREKQRGNSRRRRQAKSWAQMHGSDDSWRRNELTLASFCSHYRPKVEVVTRGFKVRDPLFH